MKQKNNIYFLGIGGIGMSALARYFLSENCRVMGYDLTETPLTRKLVEEGAEVHYEDAPDNIPRELTPENCQVIITPAIPAYHREKRYFQEWGFSIKKRAEVLGDIATPLQLVAIAGTHGKTSTSSLTAHLFHQSELSCTAFLGGISINYRSNLLLSQRPGAPVVMEADEFDRSFLHLFPTVAVITAIEDDHLDIYKDSEDIVRTFNQFASQVKEGGRLIVHHQILSLMKQRQQVLTYGVDNGDFFVEKHSYSQGVWRFDIRHPQGVVKGCTLHLLGRINLENAVAAAAAALSLGVSEQAVREGLSTFRGVTRRLERCVVSDRWVYIDDYAHHPTELNACISAIKEAYPNRRLTVLFQPHLFTRTRDFAKEFAQALYAVDEVWLLAIYPAREEPIEGITSDLIGKHLPHVVHITLDEVIGKLPEIKEGLFLTVGAGDIGGLVPQIKEFFAAQTP